MLLLVFLWLSFPGSRFSVSISVLSVKTSLKRWCRFKLLFFILVTILSKVQLTHVRYLQKKNGITSPIVTTNPL